MPTKVYGASDDLIEFEGDFTGEVSHYSSNDKPALIVMGDGTLLEIQYGKNDVGIWAVRLVKKGELFDRIDQCDDEDDCPHSDVAHFRDGIKMAYVGKDFVRVK